MTLEEKLRKSNPWAGERCGRQNCFQCQTDEGGDCWRGGSLILSSVMSVEQNILERVDETASQGEENT